jgi:hypothetical protein
MARSTTFLPDSYRWADAPAVATLYLRYGCAAKVTPGWVTVFADGPFPEVGGPCGSIAQGKRFAERFIQVRTKAGTAAQQERWWASARCRRHGASRALQEPDDEPLRLP